jgi:hypothetical protein
MDGEEEEGQSGILQYESKEQSRTANGIRFRKFSSLFLAALINKFSISWSCLIPIPNSGRKKVGGGEDLFYFTSGASGPLLSLSLSSDEKVEKKR